MMMMKGKKLGMKFCIEFSHIWPRTQESISEIQNAGFPKFETDFSYVETSSQKDFGLVVFWARPSIWIEDFFKLGIGHKEENGMSGVIPLLISTHIKRKNTYKMN